jgi:hypothetical protein
VVARGHLRRLEEDEQARADDRPGRPWVSTPKYDVVELTPDTVTGKRFRLDLGGIPERRRAGTSGACPTATAGP